MIVRFTRPAVATGVASPARTTVVRVSAGQQGPPGVSQPPHRVVTATSYAMGAADWVAIFKPSPAADVAAQLPAAPDLDHPYTLIWALGDPLAPAANFLTVTDPGGALINGKTDYVFNVNRGIALFYWDGTEWSAT